VKTYDYDFDAVVFDGEIRCIGCVPENVSLESDRVHPIFADDEVETALVCEVCGEVHDYMNIMRKTNDRRNGKDRSDHSH